MVMGDLVAEIGCGSFAHAVGPFGLGVSDERGERWTEWGKRTIR